MTDLLRVKRLTAQLLAAPADSVLTVAAHFGAMQGQDLGAVLWALGQRARSSGKPATVTTVRDSFNRGEVVRGWPMRGTLHAVPAADLGWMLSLTTERLMRGAASRRAGLGLDEQTLDRARSLAIDLLGGGHGATRAEFLEHLERNGISTESSRGYHIIWSLSQTGVLCWGPFRAAEQELRLMDEWITNPTVLDRDDALCEFFSRYINGHGPATLSDFAAWTGLTMGDCRTAVRLATERGRVHPFLHNNESYFVAELTEPGIETTGPRLIPLAGFDEYYLGYRARDAVIHPDHAQRVVPGNNGMFKPVLLQDGVAIGTWKRKATSRGLLIEVSPFEPMPKRQLQHDLELVFQPFADFWETPLRSVTTE
ncbi:winged helix DNA-binding domain-containing protein [Lysinibacter cavernae]|uniref:Winged helix DNA-binding domain-containing protein n=1 Tax=Lysinibacter cavernae TaxID=1640652 RepID=A0A7X5QZD8_9MICO|nr:winged helix DNA-binding domain-containing protein [Lysinibacter cavernae]NIH52768.1 hypothetical protein [Lysinibacter cavernae]